MTIRHATDQDLPAIIELFRLSLGEEGGVPAENFWRWKHKQNPFGASPTLLMVTEEGRIAGLRTFMYWNWRFEDKVLRALRCVDTATHPDFRGKGIFKKLTLQLVGEAKEKGFADFIFNTPNDQSKPGYLKMGWEIAGKTDLWIKPQIRGLIRRGPRFTPAPKNTLSGFDFERLTPLIQQFQEFAFHQLSTDYSPAYFQWRYQDIPEIVYEVWSDPGNQVVFFYRLKETKGLLELRVLDYLWNGKKGWAVLHQGLRDIASMVQPDVVTLLKNPGITQLAYLRRAFIPMQRKGLTVTKRRLGNDTVYDLLIPGKTWNLSSGGVELF